MNKRVLVAALTAFVLGGLTLLLCFEGSAWLLSQLEVLSPQAHRWLRVAQPLIGALPALYGLLLWRRRRREEPSE